MFVLKNLSWVHRTIIHPNLHQTTNVNGAGEYLEKYEVPGSVNNWANIGYIKWMETSRLISNNNIVTKTLQIFAIWNGNKATGDTHEVRQHL